MQMEEEVPCRWTTTASQNQGGKEAMNSGVSVSAITTVHDNISCLIVVAADHDHLMIMAHLNHNKPMASGMSVSVMPAIICFSNLYFSIFVVDDL